MTCASKQVRPSGAPSRSQVKTSRSSTYTPNLRRPSSRCHGYFVAASSAARVRLRPTGSPGRGPPSLPNVLASSRVRMRSDCALPSKPPIAAAISSSASSPLCPKGG